MLYVFATQPTREFYPQERTIHEDNGGALFAVQQRSISIFPTRYWPQIVVLTLLVSAASLYIGTRKAVHRYDTVAAPGTGSPVRTGAAHRPAYLYSVVHGGVHNQVEVISVIQRDPLVAAHYQQIQTSRVHPEVTAKSGERYVSYRKNGRIYWSSKAVRIPAGEKILTDGASVIRARCGNLMALTPQSPTYSPASQEPSEDELDRVTTDPTTLDRVASAGINLKNAVSARSPKQLMAPMEMRMEDLPSEAKAAAAERVLGPFDSIFAPLYAGNIGLGMLPLAGDGILSPKPGLPLWVDPIYSAPDSSPTGSYPMVIVPVANPNASLAPQEVWIFPQPSPTSLSPKDEIGSFTPDEGNSSVPPGTPNNGNTTPTVPNTPRPPAELIIPDEIPDETPGENPFYPGEIPSNDPDLPASDGTETPEPGTGVLIVGGAVLFRTVRFFRRKA